MLVEACDVDKVGTLLLFSSVADLNCAVKDMGTFGVLLVCCEVDEYVVDLLEVVVGC